MKQYFLIITLIACSSLYAERTLSQYSMEFERTIKQKQYQKAGQILSNNIVPLLKKKEMKILNIINDMGSMDQAKKMSVTRPNKEIREFYTLKKKFTNLVAPAKRFITRKKQTFNAELQKVLQGQTKLSYQQLLKKHSMGKVYTIEASIIPAYEEISSSWSTVRDQAFILLAESNMW